MDIQNLERAIRSILSSNPPQTALAAVAGHGQFGVDIPPEFADAARTLLEREEKPDRKTILGTDLPAWA